MCAHASTLATQYVEKHEDDADADADAELPCSMLCDKRAIFVILIVCAVLLCA